jgi:hypothetical protein
LFLALFAVTIVAPPSRTYAAATSIPAVPTNVENAVVKVFSTLRYPDPFKPWTKQAPSE